MKASQKISFADVDLSAPQKYILSINLKIDGLSFLLQNREKEVVHQEAFEWIGARDWSKTEANIKQLSQEHEMLKLKYPKVNVFLQSKHTFLIPAEYFQENKIAELYQLYFGEKHHKVLFSPLESDSYLVYGVSKPIARLLNAKWNISWGHLSKYFILDAKAKCSREQEVYLNFQNNYFEVAAFNKKKLQAHNYFDYSSSEEFIFDLLSFIRQIGFEIEYVQIYIGGNIAESSALHKLVEKYLPNVHFSGYDTEETKPSILELTKVLAYAHH